MPASTPPPPAARGGNVLTRKLGPAPVYVWVAAALVGYLLYRHYAAAPAAGSATSSPSSSGFGTTGATTSNGSGTTDNGSNGGGGATAVDSLSADLLSQLFGDTAQINNNLTSALLGSTSAVQGLGLEAIDQAGALEQQAAASDAAIEQTIINSYTPQPANQTVPTSPAAIAPTPQAAPAPAPTRAATTSGAGGTQVVTSTGGGPAVQVAAKALANDIGAVGGGGYSGQGPVSSDAVLSFDFPSSPSNVRSQAAPSSSASGAGAVKSGAARTNSQAAKNARGG